MTKKKCQNKCNLLACIYVLTKAPWVASWLKSIEERQVFKIVENLENLVPFGITVSKVLCKNCPPVDSSVCILNTLVIN